MIEKIIEWSAKNRFLVLLFTAFLAASGWWALRRTPVDAIPDLSDPQVIVFTEWMGRSPTLLEDQVTYPIVSRLLSAPHVTAVRGFSMFGMSFVYVVFEEGTDLYWARSRVLEYMNTIQRQLPSDATTTLGPDATGIGWVFEYALVDRSGKHDLAELRTFQDFSLRYSLASVPGVAEVATVGGFQKQYQVTVDPEKMRALGVSLPEVVEAIRRSNSDVGGRVVEMSQREYYVRGRGYLTSREDIEKISLRVDADGTPVTVGRIASQIELGPDIRRGLAELDGDGETVGGIVVMRYGGNARDVLAAVKARLAESAKSFPSGVEAVVTYDRSGLIDRSAKTLRDSLLEEMIVVSLVIAIFLLHARSTLVAALAIPLGVLAAFIPMKLIGLSSNIMSMGGIAIAIGAMVDAAIVMVENAHKKLEHAPPGADRGELLIEAAKEAGPAIFFSLLIITVAFLPIFTLPGQGGRLFKPLAFTKTFVMAASALLSVTLIPALLETFVRGRIRKESEHPVSRLLIAGYKPFVYVALRRPKTTIAIGIAAIISAIPLLPKLGSEFMPPLNEGDLLYMPITFPNISIEESRRQLQEQDRLLRETPEVVRVFGKAGRAETATDPAPIGMIETIAQLRPRNEWRKVHVDRFWSRLPSPLHPPFRAVFSDERTITWEELTGEINKRMQFPGWTNAWTMPIKTRVDMLTTGIRTPVGIKVFGDDLEKIEAIGSALETVLPTVPGTRSVYYERNLGGLYIDVIPDRDALARYGLTVGDVQDVVEAALGGNPVTTTVEGRGRFTVNVRYPRDLRSDLPSLRNVQVPLSRGSNAGGMGKGADAMGASPSRSGPVSAPPSSLAASVPLGAIADIRIANGPPMIRDENGLLAGYVFVDFDTSTRDVGGYVADAKQAVAAAEQDGRVTLPDGYRLEWTGQYELLEQMTARMKLVLPLTLAIIVLLLFLHFRNLVEVGIVLLSIPFALVGSVWLLYLLHYRLSTAVWVGVIALAGLAAQTGIVMIVYIDHAYERRRAAGRIRDLDDIIWAHMEGTVLRVRPKLMTVSTMLFGLVPLLWATGSGADVMKRIAAPMVGGLLSSAFLTLEIIPVIYTYWRREQLLWERLHERMESRRLFLERALQALSGAVIVLLAAAVAPIYVELPHGVARLAALAAGAVILAALVTYARVRHVAIGSLSVEKVRW